MTAVLLALAGCASDNDPAAAGEGALPAAANADPVPAALANLTDAQVGSLLGPADFRRLDGPALLMQYRSSPCVLDIVLYRDAARGDDFRVTYVESRGANAARVANSACLASVRASRGQARG
jgi:hypothetical protein